MQFSGIASFLTAFAVITAMDIGFYERPGVVIKLFNRPFPVLYDLAQNSFLHIFGRPSVTLRGSGAPRIVVPLPRDKYVWELTGYFEARRTGTYRFRFRNLGITTFQIGAGRMCYEDVHESITEKITYIDELPLEVTLESGMFYPLKITHLSEAMDLALFLQVPREKVYTSLEQEVFQIEPRLEYTWQRSKAGKRSAIRGCHPMSISDLGLTIGAYSFDRAQIPTDVSYFRNRYEQLRKIIDRPVDRHDGRIESHNVYPSFIADISGYLRYFLEGTYVIRVIPLQTVSIQIGPGILESEMGRESGPEIDDDWIFIDSRDFQERTIKLEKSLIYPFRIVYMSQESDITFELNVTDRNGKEIDIFGLWGIPRISALANLEEITSKEKTTRTHESTESSEELFHNPHKGSVNLKGLL